jgi:hypothetical protein
MVTKTRESLGHVQISTRVGFAACPNCAATREILAAYRSIGDGVRDSYTPSWVLHRKEGTVAFE